MSKWALLGLIVSAYLVCVAHSVFQCTDALPKVTPCQNYVLGGATTPSAECCAGLNSLDKATTKHEDRKALCECAKEAAKLVPIDFSKINQIPNLCHIPFNLTIGPDMDCNKV